MIQNQRAQEVVENLKKLRNESTDADPLAWATETLELIPEIVDLLEEASEANSSTYYVRKPLGETGEPEAKPCPFCGLGMGPGMELLNMYVSEGPVRVAQVGCVCGARGPECFGEEGEAERNAVELWNCRYEDPSRDRESEPKNEG